MAQQNIKTRLTRAALVAGVLYIWDGFIFGMPFIGFFAAAAATVAYTLLSLNKFFKKEQDTARQLVFVAAVYLCAIMAIVSTHSYSQEMGENNARQIVSAVRAYHAEHGKYPQKLTELVPKHLSKIPRARLSVNSDSFQYTGTGDDYQLQWLKVSPAIHRIYRFKGDEWLTIDKTKKATP